MLTLEISELDPFISIKLDIDELNGMETTSYIDITLGQSVPKCILTFMHLIVLGGTNAFMLEPLFRDSVWEHLSLHVIQENEVAIWRYS